jgi:hypothetical protein
MMIALHATAQAARIAGSNWTMGLLAQGTPPPTAPPHPGLTAGGWMMMTASITLVCGLCGFCLYRILRDPGGQNP